MSCSRHYYPCSKHGVAAQTIAIRRRSTRTSTWLLHCRTLPSCTSRRRLSFSTCPFTRTLSIRSLLQTRHKRAPRSSLLKSTQVLWRTPLKVPRHLRNQNQTCSMLQALALTTRKRATSLNSTRPFLTQTRTERCCTWLWTTSVRSC